MIKTMINVVASHSGEYASSEQEVHRKELKQVN